MHAPNRRLTLGKRIAFGFGTLVFITLVLGTFSIIKMRGVGVDAARLSEQYVPEVEICSDMEGATYQAMLAVRAFSYTGDDTFHRETETNLNTIQGEIEEGRLLVSKYPGLVKLKTELADYETKFAEFKRLIEETKRSSDQVEAARTNMDRFASQFITAVELFQDAQTEAMAQAVASNAPASQSLAEGASEQAASLEETSSSLEEMSSSMTKRNAAQRRPAKAKEPAGQHARPPPAASDMQAMDRRHEGDIKPPATTSPRSSRPSTKSPSRPTSSPSTPPSKPPAPARPAWASPSSPTKCAASPSAAPAAKETATKIEDAISKTALGVQISDKVATASRKSSPRPAGRRTRRRSRRRLQGAEPGHRPRSTPPSARWTRSPRATPPTPRKAPAPPRNSTPRPNHVGFRGAFPAFGGSRLPHQAIHSGGIAH
jgi:hypothetical protein